MMHSCWLRLVAFGLALFWPVAGLTADGDRAQPYEKVSYPSFSNGRLYSLLEADRAEVFDITDNSPRINMENVVIILYDQSAESLAATPEDQPLPVKTIITSDRGFLTRRPPQPGAEPEEIANLEGNVIMRRFRVGDPAPLRPSRLDPEVETEIRCEHARWNHTERILKGDGDVEFLQEDSRILGTGFLYLADDEALDTAGSSNIKDWGGIIFLERNPRMEIDSAAGRTVITCKETASYKLREREIQFERDVVVRSPGLVIESDILKVFLWKVEELPEHPDDNDHSPLPGQVRSIIATIGNRPGSVVISGSRVEDDGRETPQFAARGGRADFDYADNRISLVDARDGRWPEVEFGPDRDRISDGSLIFSFIGDGDGGQSLDTLHAFGGNGQVILRTRQAGDTGPTVPTRITYRGDMQYSRPRGRIRFTDTVRLERDDLTINAEALEVHLEADGISVEPTQVRRITAEIDVTIDAGDRQAHNVYRAEYDLYSAEEQETAGVDTLRLFGPPQRTTILPQIRDSRGSRIEAQEIHMQRLKTAPGQKDRHLLVARGAGTVCDFFTDAGNDDRPRLVSIKCENGLEYNEVAERAHFEGKVLATSDAPEDSYVLTSDRLIINFKEGPDPENPADDRLFIRRITADGSARLEQDHRVCEAVKIIRDFPTLDEKGGDIYLQGVPAEDSRPAQMAVYREQNGPQMGAMFAAVLIKSSATGDRIEANGPGQLSMPDDIPGQRSEIHFQNYASYESFATTDASQAIFRGGVVLRQESRGTVITSDELFASFLQDDDITPAPAGEEIVIERIGRLRRADFKGAVRVEALVPNRGRRLAIGDRGTVEFESTGNIIRMTAERDSASRGMVLVQDHDGLTLHSPAVEMREGQGYTRADGPGELHIPGDRAGEGAGAVPTAVWFGERGSMVYNELALNIRVTDSVRIVQPGLGGNWRSPSLDGSCDRLEISLMEPPTAGLTGDAALSRVRKMDASGNVIIRVYADPPPENPQIDWLSRPGTTFFCRGDHGEFYVQESRLEMSGSPGRQPQLLLNVVDSGRPPHRQRMQADRFILDPRTRRWSAHGQQDSSTIREGEAFEFRD